MPRKASNRPAKRGAKRRPPAVSPPKGPGDDFARRLAAVVYPALRRRAAFEEVDTGGAFAVAFPDWSGDRRWDGSGDAAVVRALALAHPPLRREVYWSEPGGEAPGEGAGASAGTPGGPRAAEPPVVVALFEADALKPLARVCESFDMFPVPALDVPCSWRAELLPLRRCAEAAAPGALALMLVARFWD